MAINTLTSALSSRSLDFSLFFFFFQAEDGIRDVAVTGVQTCALPISFFLRLTSTILELESRLMAMKFTTARMMTLPVASQCWNLHATSLSENPNGRWRSEERRVGKECRSGWATEYVKKK